MRVEAAHLPEELAARGTVEPRPGQDQSDLLAGSGVLRQALPGVCGRTEADDLVLPAVPILHLATDLGQQVRVVVHCEQHRPGHGGALYGVNPIARRVALGLGLAVLDLPWPT